MEDINLKRFMAEEMNGRFKKNLRHYSCCTRLLFMHADPFVSQVTSNGGTMTEDMIEDVNVEEGETERYVEEFDRYLGLRVRRWYVTHGVISP